MKLTLLQPASRRAGLAMLALVSILVSALFGADDVVHKVVFDDAAGELHTVEANVLVEAVDGGLLLLGRDGQLWNVTPDHLERNERTATPFAPAEADVIGQQICDDLGDGFAATTTRHYVICSNTSRQYVQWCGALFERLMAAFQTHWRSRTLKLHDPEFPLVAIVFANKRQFAEWATREAGADAAESLGYYSTQTNRIILYDLTADMPGGPVRSAAEINRRFEKSLYNVATIVHEATHQIAFNSGMHTRYADNPVWLTEGMATYFETPDLKNRAGWRTVGKPNRRHLAQFLDFLKRGGAGRLPLFLTDDRQFVDPQTAADAYATAWALTYFLIKTRRGEYLEYLKTLSEKRPLMFGSPETRLKEFQAAFGYDLPQLEQQMIQYIVRLTRPR